MPPGGSVTWCIGGIEAGDVVGWRSEGRGGRARAARGAREYASICEYVYSEFRGCRAFRVVPVDPVVPLSFLSLSPLSLSNVSNPIDNGIRDSGISRIKSTSFLDLLKRRKLLNSLIFPETLWNV